MGPWTVHDVHWLAEKSLKSPTLQLLFIEQCMNSSRNLKNAWKKKKKKKKKGKTQTHVSVSAESKRSLNLHWLKKWLNISSPNSLNFWDNW